MERMPLKTDYGEIKKPFVPGAFMSFTSVLLKDRTFVSKERECIFRLDWFSNLIMTSTQTEEKGQENFSSNQKTIQQR